MPCLRGSSLFSDDPGRARGHRPAAPPIIHAAQSPDLPTAARRYLALGFSVIPLRGKVPVVTWREYQRRKPSPDELRRWVRRGLFQNVGIVCGEVSGNLAVLDFDAPDAHASFCARFPDLAETYTVATGGGGWHVYLRADVLPPSQRGDGIELRANGHQVVVPPSIHPNGQPYRVHLTRPIRCVPHLDDLVEWIRPSPPTSQPHQKAKITRSPVNPALVAAIADYFCSQGYKPNGDWLNGPCIYPEQHAHHDAKRSFGFNIQSGYGWCFTCQRSMLAKEIAHKIGLW